MFGIRRHQLVKFSGLDERDMMTLRNLASMPEFLTFFKMLDALVAELTDDYVWRDKQTADGYKGAVKFVIQLREELYKLRNEGEQEKRGG